MFKASLDNKSHVTDPNGNEIVDLTSSPFRLNQKISQYFMRKVPSEYRMRPDMVALIELGSTEKTEYIMMFNQIGNPFSIDKDDVLLIPELIEADSLVYSENTNMMLGLSSELDSSIQDVLVQNYYKHSNRGDGVDMSSYDKFFNTPIPSGNVDTTTNTSTQNSGRQPYLLDQNEQAMIIRDGRIYFNDPDDVALKGMTNAPDSSIQSDQSRDGIRIEEITNGNVDAKIQSIINGVQTDLSLSNCAYNGTNLAEFIKALNETQQ